MILITRCMKTLLFVLALLAAFPALADTRTELEKISEVADPGNGSTDVGRYDPSRFEVAKVVRKMARARPSTAKCEYGNMVGIKKVISTMSRISWFEEQDEVLRGLNRLAKAGKIEVIVARIMTDNIEGSSYCDYYDFSVFTKDGYVLNLNYDYTD
jgi:hypothetical protein